MKRSRLEDKLEAMSDAFRSPYPLPPEFYLCSPDEAARKLLGKVLLRIFPDGSRASGRISECEAYSPDDPASHSFRGKSLRNSAMFGQGGRAYVYLIYGVHYCLNAVTGEEGEGSAVLIRAMIPLEGTEYMRHRRGGCAERDICNGPGKLCRALSLDLDRNGHSLDTPPLQILDDGYLPSEAELSVTARIGISWGRELLRRYLWTPAK